MHKNLSWVHVATDHNHKSIMTVLLMYINDEYLIPEATPVAEIKLRHIYEALQPMYHVWITNPKNPLDKKNLGSFSTLQEAQKVVEDTIEEAIT